MRCRVRDRAIVLPRRYMYACECLLYLFFFFKQKTAYEMRISDWSSDVCSSDLDVAALPRPIPVVTHQVQIAPRVSHAVGHEQAEQIGRASCRERVCQYV